MTSPARPGFLGRLLAAVGGGLARGLLGRSAHAHLKQFAAGDDYWDRALAARGGWPGERPLTPDSGRQGDSRPGAPTAGVTDRFAPGPEPELVPGCTERQLSDVVARNVNEKVYLRI